MVFAIGPDGGPPPPKSAPAASPAQAWADAVAQAAANVPQPKTSVLPGATLTSIANKFHVSVSSIAAANPQIPNKDLIYTGETVYLPRSLPAQVVAGVDNSHIKPIITAMADANGTPTAKNWDTVGQTTLDMLLNNNHGAHPELAAAAEVNQLNALEPGNTSFAAANNAALADATTQWEKMGVTQPQLSPIINAYNAATLTTTSVNRYLQNPRLPHNRTIVSDLLGSEDEANRALNMAIENALTDAADRAGSDPQVRSKAMTLRAMYIQAAGPQDAGFQTAVNNANYDLQVEKPAESVADAYATGGAVAGADRLAAVTRGAGNSYYAGQIIEASQGTINSIAKDLGTLAGARQKPGRRPLTADGPNAAADFRQIYVDLSQSVAAANPFTVSKTLGPNGKPVATLSAGGKAATDIVAQAIASNAPTNPQGWQSGLYGFSTYLTAFDAGGLGMATAVALQQQGNSKLASTVVRSLTIGVNSLSSVTSDDVNAFGKTTDSLYKLRATWSPFMSADQLAKATKGYLDGHPDIIKGADAELASLGQDGDAIASVEAAWGTYGPQLSGIDGQRDLTAANTRLTRGQDRKGNPVTAFAVSQSNNVNDAIAHALGPVLPSGEGGGSVVQALLASPVWSLPKSSRSFINATLKWLKKLPDNSKVPFSSVNVGDGTLTTLSVIGLGLTGESALSSGLKGFPISSPADLPNYVYTALGFPKYLGESISGLARAGILKKVVNLPLFGETNLTTLTKTGFFKGLGSTYYGAGALAALLEAADDLSNKDYAGTAFSALEVVGNGLNAAKPFFEEALGEAAAEGIGALGSGIGVAAVLGTLIYDGIKSSEEAQANQADNAKFLEDGLGLNPGVANALAAPVGRSDLPTVAAELQAYAKANGVTPAQLLLELNRQPADKVAEFLNGASNLASGTLVGPRGGSKQITPAEGLQLLKSWADGIFGRNQVG
jgi:LysM repeat protein